MIRRVHLLPMIFKVVLIGHSFIVFLFNIHIITALFIKVVTVFLYYFRKNIYKRKTNFRSYYGSTTKVIGKGQN